MWASKQKHVGFTIVELLIVIVVIGILAAITIVAFNGVQNRARVSAITSELTSAAHALKADQAIGTTYPTTLAAANNGKGITSSSNTTYQYDTTNNGTGFCLTATSGSTIYHVDATGNPAAGACGIHGGAVTDDLIANWKFNGNANDSSGGGINGTVTGATLTTGKNGAANSAYNFNGVDQYINFSNGAGFSQPSITFAAWIKPAVISGYQNILAKELQYKYRLNGANIDVLVSANGTAWTLVNTTTAGLVAGSWQHVAVTISSNPNQITVYKNGTQLNSVSYSGPISAFNTRNLYAATHGPNAEMFNGDMDDARVYSRALSAAEIQSIYNSTDL
jgi:prepilin-type N-terminal cleavage/methylation domain-containing protein